MSGNIIKDTLVWTAITVTFLATGNEKYMLLGNFKSNASTTTLIINPASLPTKSTDIYIDDASVIELNLPAYAGPDKIKFPGERVFIGHQPDVGIDEACEWFKLPNMTTPFDTVAGMWVKPNIITTYVVRQEICGNVKWDTVIVFMDAVGMDEKLKIRNEELKIYPQPASQNLELTI